MNNCAPYAIAAGRFNADAIDDVVVTCTDLDAANYVYFLAGATNHNYQPVEIPALTTTSAIKPEGIAVGDFDHDGLRDLVIANAGVNQIWELRGKGDGTFAATATKLAAGDYARSLAVGDFDGDGKDDVAAADYDDAKLTVYLQGPSGLAAGASYNTFGDNNGVAAGDLDGDGHGDLVTADSINNGVAVLIGSKTAAGTFPTATGTAQPPEYAAHPTPAAVAIADFNRDGKLDLAVANAINPSGSIDVLLGNGDGTFGSAISLGASDTPVDIQIGDFNEDGLPDIIVTNNSAAPAVTVLLNTSH
ncbi:MAG TPA: VCBS repeat-containing protein [Thermomicrobiales bacterium]|nr:VCBS repeat-containing protein [Thermomicrobiales bacterium]